MGLMLCRKINSELNTLAHSEPRKCRLTSVSEALAYLQLVVICLSTHRLGF